MIKKYKKRKPHQYKKRKPIYKNKFFWLSFLSLIFIFSFFYFIFLTDFFAVEKFNLKGQKEISEENLILLLEKETENKILFFPSKSIFLINLNKARKKLLENFPKIAKVEIHLNLPKELDILITERKALLIVCLADREKECFALDKEGTIFEKKSAEENFLPIIKIPEFKEEIIFGQNIIKKEQVASILKISSKLQESLNVKIKEFIIDSSDKLIALTEDNWQLYFNLEENVDWQLTKLKLVLEEKIPQEKRKNLEYIELRFGNFANPKFKGSQVEQVEVETEIETEIKNEVD